MDVVSDAVLRSRAGLAARNRGSSFLFLVRRAACSLCCDRWLALHPGVCLTNSPLRLLHVTCMLLTSCGCSVELARVQHVTGATQSRRPQLHTAQEAQCCALHATQGPS